MDLVASQVFADAIRGRCQGSFDNRRARANAIANAAVGEAESRSGTLTTRVDRLGAACGWLFVAMLTAANILPGLPPSAASPADEVARYFVAHRESFLVAVYLEGLCVVPFLVFVVVLAHNLKSGDGDVLPALLISFGSVAAATALSIAGFWAVLAYQASEKYELSVIRMIFELGNVAYNFIGFPFAAFLGLASFGMRSSRWGSKWLVWAGSLAALGQLVTAGAFADRGMFAPGGPSFVGAYALFAAWIVAVCRTLWKRSA